MLHARYPWQYNRNNGSAASTMAEVVIAQRVIRTKCSGTSDLTSKTNTQKYEYVRFTYYFVHLSLLQDGMHRQQPNFNLLLVCLCMIPKLKKPLPPPPYLSVLFTTINVTILCNKRSNKNRLRRISTPLLSLLWRIISPLSSHIFFFFNFILFLYPLGIYFA